MVSVAMRISPTTALLCSISTRTRQIIHEAQARKLDVRFCRNDLYALSFLRADSVAMAEQQKWFADRPENENWELALDSDTQAYAGHLSSARDLTKGAVVSAVRARQ